MAIIFDSTILVDESRGYKPAVELLEKVARKEIEGFISGITEGELLSGDACRKEDVLEKTLNTLYLFTKIEVDNEILQKAAAFRRNYSISLSDAIIAATAFFQNAKLWTKNKKDFEKIKEIEIEEPY